MKYVITLFCRLTLAGIAGATTARADDAAITLLQSRLENGGCDGFGDCSSDLFVNRLQVSGAELVDVKLCGSNDRLKLIYSNPFDQVLPLLDMPTENDQSRSVREALKTRSQVTVMGASAVSLEGVCVDLFDAAGNRLSRTVLKVK